MDKGDRAKKVFSHTRETPPRVAPRLEGKVKNVGIKPKKKQKNMRKKGGNSGTVSR